MSPSTSWPHRTVINHIKGSLHYRVVALIPLLFVIFCLLHEVEQVGPMKKGFISCHVYGSTQVTLRSYCSAVSPSLGVCSVVGKLAGPAGTPICGQTYSLDCELGHMGQAHPDCFAYGDSMEAKARLRAQWN